MASEMVMRVAIAAQAIPLDGTRRTPEQALSDVLDTAFPVMLREKVEAMDSATQLTMLRELSMYYPPLGDGDDASVQHCLLEALGTVTEVPTRTPDPAALLAWLERRRYWLSGQHVEGMWSVHTGLNVVLGLGMTPVDALRSAYLQEVGT